MRGILLMAGIATAALFTGTIYDVPPRTSAFEVHTKGGWTWFNDPRAVRSGDKVFWGYQDGPTGDVVAASYDLNTGAVVETVLHAAFEQDDHDNPGILVRSSDQRLIYYYSLHATSAATKYRVSTNPLDVSSFASEQTLSPVLSGLHTYAVPVQLAGEAGNPIRLFHRTHISGDPEWTYNRSNDGGASWTAAVRLEDLTYMKVAHTDTDIHFFVSDHPGDPAGEETTLYHFYLDTSTPAWRKSDGTVISPLGFPKQSSEMTLIYDGGSTHVWVHDIAIGLDGKPVVVFASFPTTDHHRYHYAKWTGSAWDVHTMVLDAGTYISPDLSHDGNQVYYSGGIALDQGDPSIVYASIGEGSDVWEMWRYQTTDGGASFTTTKLTDDGGKNVRPVGVRDATDALRVIWMRGTYNDYLDYDVATWGASG